MRLKYGLAVMAVAAVALFAVACGSDNNGGVVRRWWVGFSSSNASVTGNVSIMAVWSGQEQASFQAVIDEFNKLYPNVNVKFTSAGDQLPTVLSTAVQGGNPPTLAAVAQPGLIKEFVDRGVLKPLDFAKDTISANYSPD